MIEDYLINSEGSISFEIKKYPVEGFNPILRPLPVPLFGLNDLKNNFSNVLKSIPYNKNDKVVSVSFVNEVIDPVMEQEFNFLEIIYHNSLENSKSKIRIRTLEIIKQYPTFLNELNQLNYNCQYSLLNIGSYDGLIPFLLSNTYIQNISGLGKKNMYEIPILSRNFPYYMIDLKTSILIPFPNQNVNQEFSFTFFFPDTIDEGGTVWWHFFFNKKHNLNEI